MALTTPTREQPAAMTAAELASRIEIPTRLPPRHDGTPLHHLSQSSIGLFYRCPEAFRRRYICGEKGQSTSFMFLGSVVDRTLSHYYQTQLESGELLAPADLQEFYRTAWKELVEHEEDDRGIDWAQLHPQVTHDVGLEGIGVALEQLVPQLGRPVAVQRTLEFALTPDCEWTVQAILDLETEVEQPGDERPSPLVVDYKFKGSALGQERANSDLQASLYLTGRWVEGRPADGFCFAQLLRPRKGGKVGAKITQTRRTIGRMRATRARIAQAASAIVAMHDRYGPDDPWPYAEPDHWKCSRRYCDHWLRCAGGAGL